MGVPLHVCYGGDFSLTGYHDQEFGTSFAWDTDLLAGYESTILCAGRESKPTDYESVTAAGIGPWLDRVRPLAILGAGYTQPYDRAVLREGILRRIPLMYRGEANDTARQRSLVKATARRILLRQLYKRIARFLYIGEEARQHYLKHGVNPSRLQFSPYCVDTSPFQLEPEARQRVRAESRVGLGIGIDDAVILFSGKLSHRKGVDLLVKAAHQLKRANVVVLFVGDGTLRSDLEAMAGPARLIFAGFQNQGQLSRFYHAADLLALPSRHSETWGLVVNEAMHHGLPCVVSDTVGSRMDLIIPGRTGEVTKSNDVDSIVSALERCIGYATLPGTRQAVIERVAPYSVTQAARGLADAWESLNLIPK
jgi:glycosyltransferase involved in cell wall biosynthesis